MWGRCLMTLLLVWGCPLYAPAASACEERTPAFWDDYQAFLIAYRDAMDEDRDTIRGWPVSAAAKAAGSEGTGYALAWMDDDEVPELLIGNLENWHVWQAYTWQDGKIYNLYPECDPGGVMWMTEGRMLYLEIATLDWSYHAWSDKPANAIDLHFAAAYTQELETGMIRIYRGERDRHGDPIWQAVRTDVENIRAMMPTTRMLELDWQKLANLSDPSPHAHDFETGPTRFYRGED